MWICGERIHVWSKLNSSYKFCLRQKFIDGKKGELQRRFEVRETKTFRQNEITVIINFAVLFDSISILGESFFFLCEFESQWMSRLISSHGIENNQCSIAIMQHSLWSAQQKSLFISSLSSLWLHNLFIFFDFDHSVVHFPISMESFASLHRRQKVITCWNEKNIVEL